MTDKYVIENLTAQNKLLRGMVRDLSHFIVSLMETLPAEFTNSEGAQACYGKAKTILAEFLDTEGGRQ